MRPEQKNSDDVAIRRNGSGEHLAVTLRDALMPVFRQRRLATIIFIGIFAGAVLSALLLPPTYEAEMKILVNQDRVDPVITSDADIQRGSTIVSQVSEEDLNSEVELLKSRDLLEKVVLASGLESRDESRWKRGLERFENVLWRTPGSSQTELARSVQALEDALVVDPLKKTKLIRVTYFSRDPELAARVLQNLGNMFQEKHAAVHRPPGTLPFFNQEADRYGGELAAAETRLSDFNGTEGIVSA
ncbi:MAG TPA: Wzz/FepE/Etk N-terminal domain-containing protein, partial [Candidatus Sulfotelmatobacter sp.]|nr:Wzz/FepE/Etk N-terminal domain-containing protein [Candidatus Sulfotelmatobacter sp.]